MELSSLQMLTYRPTSGAYISSNTRILFYKWGSCISECSHTAIWVRLTYLWMLVYGLMSGASISPNARIPPYKWGLHIFECLHTTLRVGFTYLQILTYISTSGAYTFWMFTYQHISKAYISLNAWIPPYEWGLHISECSHTTLRVGHTYLTSSTHKSLKGTHFP